ARQGARERRGRSRRRPGGRRVGAHGHRRDRRHALGPVGRAVGRGRRAAVVRHRGRRGPAPRLRADHAVHRARARRAPDRARARVPDRRRRAMTAPTPTLAGRRALVTGGASGIGAACARELAARGAHVTVADVDPDGAKRLADELGGEAWGVDLADTRAVGDLTLHVGVPAHNAGGQRVSPLEELRPAAFPPLHAITLGAPVTCADADPDGAKRLAGELGGEAWVVDLADTRALDDLTLDVAVLVNNAGVQRVSPIEEFRPADFRLLHAIMLEAPFLLVRA